MTLNIKDCGDGVQFSAIIHPRSSNNKIIGPHDKFLKIQLTSPPVDGAANKMCIKFLAKVLSISQSKITIVSGLQGRKKVIRVEDMDSFELVRKLPQLNGINS